MSLNPNTNKFELAASAYLNKIYQSNRRDRIKNWLISIIVISFWVLIVAIILIGILFILGI
jgi:t-SNARE complex subunit (syntaxin)